MHAYVVIAWIRLLLRTWVYCNMQMCKHSCTCIGRIQHEMHEPVPPTWDHFYKPPNTQIHHPAVAQACVNPLGATQS